MKYATPTAATLMAMLAIAQFSTGAADDEPASADSQPPQTIDAAQFDSLQAAIDALPASGGVVRIPPGTYELSEPLRITGEDVLIQGAGSATHLKNTNTQGAAALELLPPGLTDRTNPGERTNRWRIQIADLRITGNEQSGHGIDALWVNEIFLHGVTISDHGGDGIRLDHCYEDPRINDCLVTYNKGVGINLLGCHDIVVSACHFEENGDALHCIDGFNLCMTGNNLDDHLASGVVIENTYGSVVSGNMIEECQGTAIILDRDCYGITLSANVIAHNGGGIELLDAHGCAVSANTFTIIAEKALYIGPASARITVTGNNFSNSYIGDGQVKRGTDDMQAAGVTLEGTSDIAISGNVFSGLTEDALILTDPPSSRVILNGNVFADVAVNPEPLHDSLATDNLATE